MIIIKNSEQLALMKQAGRITAEALLVARDMIRPGVTTREIDRAIRAYIEGQGAVPSFLGCAAYEANSVALQAGLNVSYSGAVSSGGVAVAQSIAEGAEVARGTVVSVTFAANTSDGNSD